MKQKTSYFNWGISRSYLKRCWPLWAVYFAVLLLCLPAAIPDYLSRNYSFDYNTLVASINGMILNVARTSFAISFFTAILAAMVVYSYLYNTRACGMMNALPIRRETAFITAYLTGLVPLILADILTALITYAVYAHYGVIHFKYLMVFVAYAVMGNVAFFGFASFCAVLTGNIAVLPVVYVLLNVLAYITNGAFNALRGFLTYGFIAGVGNIRRLSPVIALFDSRDLDFEDVLVVGADGLTRATGEFTIHGTGLVAAYCAAGLILSALALAIYRKRDMERAGDVVAIPVLKPVFKYCMSVGCGVVCAIVFYDWLFSSSFGSTGKTAVIMAVLMVLGAGVGYFVAEMLMQKTLDVFHHGWRDYIITACALVVFTACIELDVTGYETAQPELDEIEEAYINSGYGDVTRLESPEELAALLAYHREVIDGKHINEHADKTRILNIDYTLKNGESFARNYRISYDYDQRFDLQSNTRRLEALLNSNEAILSRLKPVENIDFDWITSSSIEGSYMQEYMNDIKYDQQNIYLNLTPGQTEELYDCILADVGVSSMGRVYMVKDREFFESMSNLSFYLGISAQAAGAGYDRDWGYYFINVEIPLDAENTLNWIRENTDIEPISLYDSNPESAESQIAENTEPDSGRKPRAGDIGIIGGADGPTAIFTTMG